LSRVGIVSALAAEARSLGPATAGIAGVRELADGMLLIVSGMGCNAAATAARALASAGATALASFGLAGALDPALECGTVLLPEDIVLADGTRLPTSGSWRERVRRALPSNCSVRGGVLLTSLAPIGSASEKEAAWRATGAVGVDMESAAVAQVAAERALPFIALRVIVDLARDELPEAVIAASRGGRLSIGQLLRRLAGAPADIGALLRLSGRYRRARSVLRQIARPASAARRTLGDSPRESWR
jgi:hopanoid-associated phosphorylase